VPQTVEQARACAHVQRVFGRGAATVRFFSPDGTRPDICVVKVVGLAETTLEFICVGGILVGIPPKRPPYK